MQIYERGLPHEIRMALALEPIIERCEKPGMQEEITRGILGCVNKSTYMTSNWLWKLPNTL